MNKLFIGVLLSVILYSCQKNGAKETPYNKVSILVSDVHIVDVENGKVEPNQYVLILDNLISEVSSTRPQGSFDQEINGSGKYLMPGLVNMYTHVNEDNLILYLVNGQTTIKDAPSHLTALGLRERIKSGELIGPRIFAVGLRATGMPAPYPSQQPVRTEEEAREQVREAKRLGYDGMFIYASCDPDTYGAIMDEAKKLNFHISGHFPQNVSLKYALNRTQQSFDNLSGLTRGGELRVDKDSLFDGMVENGQAVTPTLTIHRLWSLSDKNDSIYEAIPKQYIPNKMKTSWNSGNGRGTYPYEKAAQLIKEMYEKGIPIYVGSDGGYPLAVNGFSYHQELENLSEIGIPNSELLKFATIESAKFLDYDSLGLIKKGFKADLLLLEKNPLLDIKNLKEISYVLANGHPLSKDFLNEQLQDLENRIKDPKYRFDSWLTETKDWKESDSILHYSFLKNGTEVGEEKVRIRATDRRNFTLESINVMDGPDMRETYTYISVTGRRVDSLSLKSITPEGIYQATIVAGETKASLNGSAPFHGDFSYSEPVYSGTLFLGPFTSRYFELDIAVNYLLAMLMKRSLNVGQADQLPVIQIELNSEEFGKKLIIDNSEYTIYRQEEGLYKVIYHPFSGYRTITTPIIFSGFDNWRGRFANSC